MKCHAPAFSRPPSRARLLAPAFSRFNNTLLLVLACACPGLATPPVSWDSGRQGGFVTALTGDRQGHIWVAAEDDGVWEFSPSAPTAKQWTQFTAENTGGGLGDDDIYSLTCDRLGRVWAGTGRSGVAVFTGRQWKTYDRLTGPLGCHVVALATSPVNGDVWGCTEAGLFRYSLAHNTWTYSTRADGLPSDQPDCLAFAKNGTLFVGTDCDGLAIASPADGYTHWRHIPGPDALPDAPGGDGLPSALVNCLLVSRGGTVCAGTDCGLARSSDDGHTWRFLRGADWRDKLAGLETPVPPRDVDTGGRLLAEDYVTALAEDGAERLYIGHRRKGLGVYDERTVQGVASPGAYGGYVDALLPTRGGRLLIGTYGDGLTQTAWLAPAAAIASSPYTTFPPLPAPAAPPTLPQLAAMLRRVKVAADTLPVGGAQYLGADWQTQGDWLGRYGRQCAVLLAADAPLDHDVISDPSYDVRVQLGPHHAPGDTIRRYCTWAQTDNPKSLYDPIPGCRRQSEADDHGETLPSTYEGPDVWAIVTVPDGLHRLGLYDMNKDGHDGDNRFRDYRVDVLPYQDSLDDAQSEKPLARARIAGFWGGVYESFLVRGPARYYVRVAKNGSLNAILPAVFLDRVGVGGDPRRDANAWMGGVRYAPPDPDAPLPPDPHLLDKLLADSGKLPAPSGSDPPTPRAVETITAARDLWDALDADAGNLSALPLQIPDRLAAYRAAVHAGAPDALQAAWRWTLHVWTQADRQQFADTMQRAHDSLLALNPDMRNHSY